MLNLWARVKQLCSAKKEPPQKELALEQMHDFVISVGQAHLACALVEQELHDLLRSFGYPDIDVPAWLAPGQRKRLGKAIVALQEQFGLPSSFAKHLEQFRQQRNEFTHNIWRDGDAPLRVGSELTKMHQKVRDLHRTARELSKLFSDLLMKAHEIRFQVATKMLEDEIDVFKRRWPS